MVSQSLNVLLIPNSNPIPVIPCLAEKIGINGAVILQQIYYWCEQNKKKSTNYRDGHYWTYGTYSDWAIQFPWMGESTIRATVKRLEVDGLLISGNYNKTRYDKTKWYRVNKPLINESVQPKTAIPSAKNEQTELLDSGAPIPDIFLRDKNDTKEYADSSFSEKMSASATTRRKNIFSRLTEQYGKQRVSATLDIVDQLIDKVYPSVTGKPHAPLNKPHRMAFVGKLLDFQTTFEFDTSTLINFLNKIINTHDCEKYPPTIFYLTTPEVLGYWLLTLKDDFEMDAISLRDTIYAPVDTLY